jgi:hypothetical protein
VSKLVALHWVANTPTLAHSNALEQPVSNHRVKLVWLGGLPVTALQGVSGLCLIARIYILNEVSTLDNAAYSLGAGVTGAAVVDHLLSAEHIVIKSGIAAGPLVINVRN